MPTPEIVLFLAICIGIFIQQRCFGLMSLHNPAAFFFLSHVLLLGAGGLYRSIYEEKVPISDATIFIVSYSILLYSLGVLFSSKVLHSGFNYTKSSHHLPEVKPDLYLNSKPFMLLVFLTPIIFTLIFHYKTGALIWLLDDADNARMEMRRGLGAITLLGIASCFLASLILIHHFKPRLIWALGIILFFSFISALYGNRGPAGFVFLSSLYYYFLVKKQRSDLIMLFAGGILFIGLMSLNIIRQGLDSSFIVAFQQVLWRPFVNFQNLDLIYKHFYLKSEFEYGMGYIRDILVLSPSFSQNNAEWIKEHLNMQFSGGGLTITYLGELLLNFSIYPIFIIPFLLGILFQTVFVLMLRLKLSAMLMILVSFSLMPIISSGLIPPALNVAAPLVLIGLLFWGVKLLIQSFQDWGHSIPRQNPRHFRI